MSWKMEALLQMGAVLALAAVPATARADTGNTPATTFKGPAVVIESSALPRPACRPLKPFAPDQARLLEIAGTVTVEYTVFEDGHVGDISLAKSEAHPSLGEAVRNWLDGCAFTPLVKRGHPISLRMIQPYVFKLKQS